MNIKIRSILFFFFSFICVSLASDSLTYSTIYPSAFTAFDVDQGLLVSCVEETFTDPKGRLWINPCRNQDMHIGESFFQFDGNKSYTVSLPDPDQGPRGSSWLIKNITAEGILYGTNLSLSHVIYFDPDTEQSHIFSFKKGEAIINLLGQENDKLIAITKASNSYSIYSITREKKELLGSYQTAITGRTFEFPFPATVSDDMIWFLHEDSGFIQFDLDKKNFTSFYWEDLLDTTIEIFSPNRIINSNNGTVTFYCFTLDRCYDFNSKTGRLLPNNQLNGLLSAHPPGNDKNERINFFKDKSGNKLIEINVPRVNEKLVQNPLYLLDHTGKISRYHLGIGDKEESKRLGHNFNNSQPMNIGFASSSDFSKQATISTNIGLILLEYRDDLAIKAFQSGWGARGIIEYAPNQLIVLSDDVNKGIVDLEIGEFINTTFSSGQFLCGQDFVVSGFNQIIYQEENKIWFAGNQDLIEYDKKDKTCERYPVGQEFEKVVFINENEVVLANRQEDMYIYDLDRQELIPFLIDNNHFNVGGKPSEMYFSDEGILWVASLNGLWKINPESKEVFHLNEKNGLSDNRIVCIQKAQDGKLWLGMINGGIQVYDPINGNLKLIDQKSGLSNNTVVGILEDEDGDKWVSTFSGITVFSNEGEMLFKLFEKDGLSHKEFNRFSYHESSNGKFIFGAVSGINVLEPEKIKQTVLQKDDIRLYLTELGYFNKKKKQDIILRGNFDGIKQITLPATHRYIDVNFSSSDYLNTGKGSFSYQLVGNSGLKQERPIESAWISIGSNSYLTLNDLPVGSHHLYIRGIDHKGQLIDEMISIPIKVKAFFYKTWWFYLLCALPFILGVFLWNRQLVAEKKRLESEVQRRTQQIRQDKQLIEQQAEKLQELDEMKSRFFTNISHEFRTPLSIISSMSNQIEANPEKWLEKGNELIMRNSQHLLSLINQILDLRKLESGALKVNLVQGDIISYLQYIADSFLSMAHSRGIRIHFLTKLKSLDMDYEPDKMLQICSNLISNAIKYSPEGSDIYLQVNHQKKEDSESFEIEIKDTGHGISPEALPFIFDRFYQVEDLANQKPMGSGVGLALTKELVQLLNGTIEVERELYKGTTFTLNFPITREATHQNVELQTPLDETDLATKSTIQQTIYTTISTDSSLDDERPTLLIVEDNEDVLLYLTTSLEVHYQLMSARNGQKGIELALDQVPDIIISDVMMPLKNGYELCDTLKNDERTSHIPIIMLTAKADFESRLKGLQKQADAYLTKPFQEEELLLVMNNQLEVRKILQQKYASVTLEQNNDSIVDKKTLPSLEDAFLQKLQKLILDNIDQPKLNTDFICQQMGMSKTNIFRKLKALTGYSLSHFIRRIRLQKAKELLQDPDLNINEVAYAVGFADPYYFSRVFSETFQQSPTEFRKS